MTDNIDEALLSDVTLKVARALNLDMNNRTLGKRIIGVAKTAKSVGDFEIGKYNIFFLSTISTMITNTAPFCMFTHTMWE